MGAEMVLARDPDATPANASVKDVTGCATTTPSSLTTLSWSCSLILVIVVVVVHDGSEYDDVKEVDCRNWMIEECSQRKVGTESVPNFHV